jgi:hypothetical protein
VVEFSLKVLTKYHSRNIEEIIVEMKGSALVPLQTKRVRNEGNVLGFMYSTKAASLEIPRRDVAPLQPEVLAVDLDESKMPVETILDYVYKSKLPEWSQGSDALEKAENDVFQVPGTKYWVTSIPVWSKEDRGVLQTHMMCDCKKSCKIVVLAVNEGKESFGFVKEKPPTVDTAAYLATLVGNTPRCETLYNNGQKLVE